MDKFADTDLLSASCEAPESIQDLASFLKKEYQSLKKYIKAQFVEYEKSLDINSVLIDDLTTIVTNLKTEVKHLKKEKDELKKENSIIITDLKQVKCELTELQQYSRRTYLEITHLPEAENENINDVLTKVFSSLEQRIYRRRRQAFIGIM